MSKLKFGSDPEFFASYQEDGEHYVLPPVFLRKYCGAKAKENGSHPIYAKYGDTLVHEDGAAFEMSTPPSNDWKEMWGTLDDAKHQFEKKVLSKFSDVCDPILYSIPAMHWQVSKWENEDQDFHLSTIFGCDADQDVFNMSAKASVVDASLHPWRYAGGHIHVSGLKEIEKYPLRAIKSMVLTAGLACTAYSDVPDLEHERLYLYGRPGKFRLQKYSNKEVGVEYRTPSTRWTSNFDMAEKIFSWAEIGINALLAENILDRVESDIMEDAKKAILDVDQTKAKELLAYIQTNL